MTEFESLQKKHYDLQVRLDQKPGEVDIQEIEAFIEYVKVKAANVVDPVDRDQLRAMLRSWASYIYDQKGVFPDTTLRPADPEKKVQFFGQMDGRLITPGQIREVIDNG